MDIRHTIEMSISREEFFRLLPAAVGPFVTAGDVIRPSGGRRRWEIHLVPLGDRRIGSVVVPRHHVEIVLEGCAAKKAEAFMARFHRAFLRGGG